jgi:hypothetical protein
MLTKVPKGLREELRDAVASLDSVRIADTIDKVSRIEAELAAVLYQLTKNFDYMTILKVLDEVKE